MSVYASLIPLLRNRSRLAAIVSGSFVTLLSSRKETQEKGAFLTREASEEFDQLRNNFFSLSTEQVYLLGIYWHLFGYYSQNFN